MRKFKSVLSVTLILSLLFGSFISVYGEHASEGEVPIVVAGIGVLTLALYDIFTAPSSARRYNASLYGMNQLNNLKYQQYPKLGPFIFGKPRFSRASLVVDNNQPPVYSMYFNENLYMVSPLFAVPDSYYFEQLTFSRNALVRHYNQTVASAPKQSEKHRKSPTTALLWSLGATLIPTAAGIGFAQNPPTGAAILAAILISSGVIIGPSTGHWYAKQKKRAVVTAGLRLGLGILTVVLLSRISFG
ncbi:hypothetical protein IH970_05525 [candidate division KSB1 bacterium]|nr:hypothetical protein [candidate division KSB1 bacterium]